MKKAVIVGCVLSIFCSGGVFANDILVTGKATKKLVNTGSKSEHEALVVQTDSREWTVDLISANPFDFPNAFEPFIGKTIELRGEIHNGRILVKDVGAISVIIGPPEPSQQTKRLIGKVVRKTLNVGSKSEHEGFVLRTRKGIEYPVIVPVGNPFELPNELLALEGKIIEFRGTLYRGQLIIQKYRFRLFCEQMLDP